MPRVQKRPEMPIIRRKCYSCSKMATKPYVYHMENYMMAQCDTQVD